MTDDKQISARISKELHRAARIKALKTGKSMTQVISELLQGWVNADDDSNAEARRGPRSERED